MAKAIMLSIKPKYISMILNKTKTIEVRKRFPKDYEGWVYIYCTKDKTFAHFLDGVQINGKVVARFYCDKVDMPFLKDITKESCLTLKELIDYLEGKPCNAIHISQLEIFDKPKELSEFVRWYPYYKRPYELITKAPQNYCYVEVE